jgi:hypothetical protein
MKARGKREARRPWLPKSKIHGVLKGRNNIPALQAFVLFLVCLTRGDVPTNSGLAPVFHIPRLRRCCLRLFLAILFAEDLMADSSRFTIICPCCEATLTIDAQTGALISHEDKTKPLASFDEMVKGLDKQKQMREQIFAQELSSMKDRDRILEEKFQEAMKRAEKDKDKPYRNPLDID